jgi:hypothetical protein
MVDARIPERYLSDRRILRLTDAERSSLWVATLWSVSNRTDGRIERADVDLIPMFRSESINTFVIHGLWESDGDDAWVMVDYARDQTTRDELEVLENARRRERAKKQRQRARKDDVPGDVPGGLSPGTAQDRQGRKEGQEGQEYSGSVNTATGVIADWPTRLPGEPVMNDEEPW